MKFPKLNFEKILEDLDVTWASIEIGLLFLTYIVGKSFLQLFTSLYGWIIIVFGVAVVVSPEFNKFFKNKISTLVDKFQGRQSEELEWCEERESDMDSNNKFDVKI